MCLIFISLLFNHGGQRYPSHPAEAFACLSPARPHFPLHLSVLRLPSPCHRGHSPLIRQVLSDLPPSSSFICPAVTCFPYSPRPPTTLTPTFSPAPHLLPSAHPAHSHIRSPAPSINSIINIEFHQRFVRLSFPFIEL